VNNRQGGRMIACMIDTIHLESLRKSGRNRFDSTQFGGVLYLHLKVTGLPYMGGKCRLDQLAMSSICPYPIYASLLGFFRKEILERFLRITYIVPCR
jgi:hypothetical protein